MNSNVSTDLNDFAPPTINPQLQVLIAAEVARQIEPLVYELYDLTEEEVKIVEEASR